METRECETQAVGWRSDLNADLWSEVMVFLDPADHAAVRCVSVELRDTIADHYVNALLLEAEGAGPDGKRFPLAGSFRTAALIDLPIDPPCWFPSWGAYFTLVGGRDAVLDEIWRRPLFEHAVVLVAAVDDHELQRHQDGLNKYLRFLPCEEDKWKRIAVIHCLSGRNAIYRRPIEMEGFFSLLCGDTYSAVSTVAASPAKYCVCLNDEEVRSYMGIALDSKVVALLSFLPGTYLRDPSPRHLAFTFDWEDPNSPGEIPYGFLSECASLESVEFREIRCVTKIGAELLTFVPKLTDVTFTRLPKLKSIPPGFLGNCSELRRVKLPELPCLEEIGSWFLSECTSLTEVTFGGLPKLKIVGECFLHGCPQLSRVDFPQLEHVTTVGDRAFEGCSAALLPAAKRWIASRGK